MRFNHFSGLLPVFHLFRPIAVSGLGELPVNTCTEVRTFLYPPSKKNTTSCPSELERTSPKNKHLLEFLSAKQMEADGQT